MIVGIFGKDASIRKNANEYIKTLSTVTDRLYDYSCNLEEIKALAEKVSLFGDKTVVYGENIFGTVAKEGEALLTSCKESETIFIFDEIEEEAENKKLLLKWADHFFDAGSAKKKKEFPSALCHAIKRRDKKTAWVELMKVHDGEAELVHGAVLWQMKIVWQDILAGDKSPYNMEEIQKKNKELVVMFHRAHMGKSSLKDEMERWVLGI